MSKAERSRLLDFLSKPRCGHEIAKYFNISVEHLDEKLQTAIKSGQILISEKQVPQTTLNSQGKLEKQNSFLYISRKSPLLTDNALKLSVQETGKISKLITRKVSIIFLPKAHSLAESKLKVRKGLTFNPKTETTRDRMSCITSENRKSLLGIPKSYMVKLRLAKEEIWNRRVKYKMPSNRDERKFLSHMDILLLFQVLSNQPLPFLDIHRRFGMSKQTINGFVKRGLLEEKWGQKNIGVRFKLTKKGRSYLKQLKAVARLDPKKQKNIFIRLKHRICS